MSSPPWPCSDLDEALTLLQHVGASVISHVITVREPSWRESR